MKTCALYGFISSLSGAFLTLILYFAGFHNDPAKLGIAQGIGGLLGLAIIITCLVLGLKARREETPEDQDFGFWKSFGNAFLISMISNLFSLVFTFIYNKFINPGFTELLLQERINKLEASGMSGDKLDKAEAFTRTMFSPGPQAVFFLVFGTVIAVVISLIMAGFFTRKAIQPPKI